MIKLGLNIFLFIEGRNTQVGCQYYPMISARKSAAVAFLTIWNN